MPTDDNIFEHLHLPLITSIDKPFQAIIKGADSAREGDIPFEGARFALEVCISLAEIQERAVGEYTNPRDVDVESIRQRLKEGRSVLQGSSLIPPMKDFASLLQEMLAALVEGKDHEIELIEKLEVSSETMPTSDDNYIAFKEAYQTKLQEVLGVEPNLISAAFDAAWQVFIVAEADNIRPLIEMDNWDSSTCPVCGAQLAEMARIEKREGHLYLVCPQCFTEWKYPRLRCPYCLNEDQKELAFFTAEEYPGYRVNVCHKCSGYIKATDERILNRRHVPVVDNLLTLELDATAQGEGFSREK